MRRARLSHALAVCGILLLLPAYFLPMLSIEQLVERTEAGLVMGVVELIQRGEWLLAGVIGLFSGVLPVVKLAGLAVVSSSWAVERCHSPAVYARLRWMCRLVEGTGRLGMLEVFVVAVIVFAFRASATFEVAVKPGTGVFLLLVLITMLAGHCFDPRVYGSAFDDQRT
jgi:paraquat-inducible protein A